MDWDRVVDVVVVGSGGAALVAATLASDQGAEVLIVEKDSMLGGTTAVSGGGIWLPGNHHMAEAGIEDSREAALAYIRRLTDGREPDPELLEVYVDTAPEMLRYLEDHTPVRTHISPLPDYYWPWGIEGNIPQPARAVEMMQRAMRLNPWYPDWYLWNYAEALFDLERYDEVIATLTQMRDPTEGQRLLAASHALIGNVADARRHATAVRLAHPNFSLAEWRAITPNVDSPSQERFFEGLRLAGLD